MLHQQAVLKDFVALPSFGVITGYADISW